MPDKKVQVILEGKDANLINSYKRGEQAARNFSEKTIGVFKKMNQAVVSSYDKLGALEKIGIGVGFTALAKNLIDFDSSIRKIGRTSGANVEQVAALRREIVGLIDPANKMKIPLNKGEFAEIATELNATGISLELIRKILPQVGRGAVASHTDVKAYSAAIGELLDKYKVSAADLPALQDQINMALKMEDVRKDPESFLHSLEGLSKTMQLMKSQGISNVTPLIALQAQLTSFTGSSGEAAGSLDAVFNGLLRIGKNKALNDQLKARGINFFDSKGSVKSIQEIIPQIRKLADEAQKSGKGIDQVAMSLFGRPEAVKAVMMITQKYDDIMKKQEELNTSSGSLAKDYASEQESMTNKLKNFQNQIDTFNTTHMTTALQKLSHVLDFLNAHPIIAKGLMTAVVGAGGIVMLNKVVSALGGIKDFFSGKGAGGIAGGLGKAAGMPVFVTNMPGSGFPGSGGTDRGLGTRDVDFSKAGKAAGLTGAAAWGTAAIPIVIAAGSFAASRVMQNESQGLVNWRRNNPNDYARSQEVMGGGKSVNHINMTVNIDGKRITTDTDSTDTNISVKRGAFFGELNNNLGR